MNIIYLCKIAYLNLSDRRKAAMFSASGLILGICIFTLTTSLNSGLGKIVSTEMVKQSQDKAIVVQQSQNGSVKIDQDTAKNIEGVEGINKIEQEADIAGKFSFGGATTDVVMLAVNEGYFDLNNIRLPSDVVLKKSDQDEPQPIIVNSELSRLFGFGTPKDFLGQEVFADILLTKQNSRDLTDQNIDQKQAELGKFRVVAVIDHGKNPLVYIPHQIAVEHGLTYDSQIWAMVSDPSQLVVSRIKIENMGLKTSNIIDSLSSTRKIFFYIQMVLLLAGLTMMTIAVISLINVLKSDLSMRKEEIGFLKTIGINQNGIGIMLSIENIYLTLFSALLGIAIASTIGIGLNAGFNYFAIENGYKYYPLYTIPVQSAIIGTVTFIILNVVLSYYCWYKSKSITAKEGMKSA